MNKSLIFLLLAVLAVPAMAVADTVPTMDKNELRAMLDSSDLVLLDVRRGRDWSASEYKIRGATRLAPEEVASAFEKYSKDKKLVFYCA